MLAAFVTAAVAAAQPLPAAAETVGEVVVTARRREEKAQDVPIALTVTTGDALARTNTNNVQQLSQLVPTVQLLSSNPRNTAITIRGLGASYGLANDGLEQGVGVYVDQVYISRPAVATFDFVDIDRIEVLRGPQGTLFGKNTTAGALNITTRDAQFTPELRADATVASYNYLQFRGTASGPLLGETLAGRLSLVATRRDGYVDNVTVGGDQNELGNIGLRGQLLWRASEKLTLRLYGDWNRQEQECCTQVFVRYGPTLKPANQQYPALAAGRGYAPPSTDWRDRLADVDSPIRADQELGGAALVADYDFGPVTLTSISAYRRWSWGPANDRDYTRLDIVRQSANPSEQDQWSQELRLGSNGKHRIDWVAGFYAFSQNVTTHGVTEYGRDASYWLLPATNTPSALLDGYKIFNDSSIDTDSYAVFGQATWNVTDRFRITPGLRYTWESKDGRYDATVTGGLATTDATLLNRRLGIARPQSYAAKTDDGDLSGQVAVSYDLTPDVLAYGSYSRGFKSGGINMAGIPTTASGAPALTSAVVRPEAVTAWEAGLKTQLFQRRLTANLALFLTEIDDFQANVVDSGPGALRGYLANIEKVEVRGAEADVVLRPVNGLSAYLTVAFTDGTYRSFVNGPCPLERIGTATAACDLSGVRLPGVSRYAGSAGFEYARPVSAAGLAGEAYLGVDASYRSAYSSDASASRYARIDGYGIVNLRTGLRAARGWEAFLFVKNLLDEDYLQFVSVQTGNSGLVIGNPGDPRTIGATLRVRY